jgi:hypothetical protein
VQGHVAMALCSQPSALINLPHAKEMTADQSMGGCRQLVAVSLHQEAVLYCTMKPNDTVDTKSRLQGSMLELFLFCEGIDRAPLVALMLKHQNIGLWYLVPPA